MWRTLHLLLAALLVAPPAHAAGVFDVLGRLEELDAGGSGEVVPLVISGRIVTPDGRPVANEPVAFVPDRGGGGGFAGIDLTPTFEWMEGVPLSCIAAEPGPIRTDARGRYTLRLQIRAACAREHSSRFTADNFRLQARVEGYETERADGPLPEPVRIEGRPEPGIGVDEPSGGFVPE